MIMINANDSLNLIYAIDAKLFLQDFQFSFLNAYSVVDFFIPETSMQKKRYCTITG